MGEMGNKSKSLKDSHSTFPGIPVPVITDIYPKWMEMSYVDENVDGSWIRIEGGNFQCFEECMQLVVYVGEKLCKTVIHSDDLIFVQIPRCCAEKAGVFPISVCHQKNVMVCPASQNFHIHSCLLSLSSTLSLISSFYFLVFYPCTCRLEVRAGF